MVVGVAAEAHDDGHAGVDAAVLGVADVVDRRRLDHEVAQQAGARHAGTEGQAVVAGVGAEERHRHLAEEPGVAQVEAEPVAVEVDRLLRGRATPVTT